MRRYTWEPGSWAAWRWKIGCTYHGYSNAIWAFRTFTPVLKSPLVQCRFIGQRHVLTSRLLLTRCQNASLSLTQTGVCKASDDRTPRKSRFLFADHSDDHARSSSSPPQTPSRHNSRGVPSILPESSRQTGSTLVQSQWGNLLRPSNLLIPSPISSDMPTPHSDHPCSVDPWPTQMDEKPLSTTGSSNIGSSSTINNKHLHSRPQPSRLGCSSRNDLPARVPTRGDERKGILRGNHLAR